MTAEQPERCDPIVMVGTKKGLLLLWKGPHARRWHRAFHHEGWEVDDAACDPRDGSLIEATTSVVFGSLVQRSPDLGGRLERSDGLDFADGERTVARVWAVAPAGKAARSRLCGRGARALFVSDVYYGPHGGDRFERIAGSPARVRCVSVATVVGWARSACCSPSSSAASSTRRARSSPRRRAWPT